VARLVGFAESGEALRLYAKTYKGTGLKYKGPKNPLLFVLAQPARAFDIDLKNAGVAKNAPGGKLDFHSLRVAYDNLLLDAGAGVKEAQAMMRHSTPQLTMNTYGRTRQDRGALFFGPRRG